MSHEFVCLVVRKAVSAGRRKFGALPIYCVRYSLSRNYSCKATLRNTLCNDCLLTTNDNTELNVTRGGSATATFQIGGLVSGIGNSSFSSSQFPDWSHWPIRQGWSRWAKTANLGAWDMGFCHVWGKGRSAEMERLNKGLSGSAAADGGGNDGWRGCFWV